MNEASLHLLSQTLYRPPLGLAVLCVAIGLAAIALVFATGQEKSHRTAFFRIVALAGIAWLLMGPSVIKPGKPSTLQPPRLAILTDTSLSMSQGDASLADDDRNITRLEAVTQAWLSHERLTQLSEFAQVDTYEFDQQLRTARRGKPDAEGKATRLFDAITQIEADATLILSDGHDTTPATSPPNAPGAGRLFASPIGTPRSAPDLAIDAWPNSDQLFEGQTTTITASIRHRGMSGKPVIFELLHDDKTVESQTLTIDQPSTTVRFEVKPELSPGKTVEAEFFRARVRLADGSEAYLDNNTQDLFIQVSRGRVRVLLLEGEPYWDTRALARLIGSHPRFDLTASYAFGDQRRSRVLGETIEPGVDPTAQLNRYDIIVLGRRVERLVDETFGDRLTRFVQNGGAVVFARGNAFDNTTELGRRVREDVSIISPGQWGGPIIREMRLRLNESANPREAMINLSDQAVVSRLPGMLAATRIEGRKAASVVLLEQQDAQGPPMAAMTTLRVGSGLSLSVLTEGLWRWELLPGIGEDLEAESAYAGFWVRALQWLASGGEFLPGQDISLQADRLTLDTDETVTLEVNTRYVETNLSELNLEAIDAAGNRQAISLSPTTLPSRFRATYSPADTGVVRFELSAPGRSDLIRPDQPLTTRIAVIHRSPERRDTSAQPQRLKQLTEATGGRCLALNEPEPLIAYLQSLQAARGSQDTAAYAFNTWPAFAWVVGCLGIEWVLRRRSGLR